MLLVHLEAHVDDDLLLGEVWTGVDLYVDAGDDPRTAVERALAASQEGWGGLDEWLGQFEVDVEVRASVYQVRPDALLDEPVHQETFRPHERYGTQGRRGAIRSE